MTKSSPLRPKKRPNFSKYTLKKLLRFTRPYLWLLIFSIIFSLLSVAAQLLAPVFVGRAIDYMADTSCVNFEKIFYYVVILIINISLAVIFQYLTSSLASVAANRTIADLRTAAFNKLNRAPLKVIDAGNQGDFIQRVTADTERIAEGLIQGLTSLFAGFVTIIGTIALMLNLNIYISLAVILLTPLSIVVAYLIAKFSQRMFTKQMRAEGELSGHTEEYITNQKIIKLFNYENAAKEKYEIINKDIKFAGSKAVFYSALVNPSTRLLNGFVYAAVCIFGAVLIINGKSQLSIGGLSVFLTYAMQYAKPFNEISSIITEMQVALVSASRIFEILDYEQEPDESHLPNLKVNSADVKFDSVSFSYTDKPFIEDFNLSVLNGQHVAIVGKTGCGKTTLISLLMRFYEIDGGRISIDGTNTKTVSRSSVRTNIGMVLQDSWLFKGTVKENIAYGKEDATDEEIKEAAKKARIDKFISDLSEGYDTVLNPHSLSQGQMQLLCIARVFLNLPKILILDEATSNIDARTEVQIQQAFKDMTSGQTSFIVAHRLSTIKNADIILVMDNGKIIENGTHEELIKKGGKYFEMISALES